MSAERNVSLRAFAVAFVVLASLLMAVSVAVILVVNARNATQDEMRTAFELASTYLEEFRGRLQQGPEPMDEAHALARQFDLLRHIHAEVRDTQGRLLFDPTVTGPERGAAPDWFVWLLSGPPLEKSEHITRYPTILGSIVLSGDIRDEAAEVWSDFSAVLAAVAGIWAMATVATFVLVHLVRRYVATCNATLRRLGEGDLSARLPTLRLAELVELGHGVEGLAHDLGARQEENRLLQQRLMALSDSERQEVASDLHDGLGPLLFALRVSVAEAEAALPAERADRLREELGAVARHAAAIQTTLRAMIHRLRPMIESGGSPADLLGEFAAHFAEVAPDVSVRCSFGAGTDAPLAPGPGLAAYRFVQESALNAVRHGGARRISISVRRRTAGEGAPRLVFTLADDGTGPSPTAAPGYGQTGMMDRARALGGRYQAPRRIGGRTVTELELPLAPATAARRRLSLPDCGPASENASASENAA